MGIVEETANYLLDLLFASVVQEGTLIGGIGCLVILAVCDWIGCKRAMLGFERRGVSIMGKLLHDIFGHGEVNISLGVIPLEGNAAIKLTSSIFDNVVSLSSEGIVEVL